MVTGECVGTNKLDGESERRQSCSSCTLVYQFGDVHVIVLKCAKWDHYNEQIAVVIVGELYTSHYAKPYNDLF